MAHHPSRLKIKIVLWNAYKLYMIIYIYIIYSIEYHPLTLSIRWKKIILLIRILRSDAIFLILSHSNHISPSLSFSFILSFSLSLSSFALNSLPFSLSLSLTHSLSRSRYATEMRINCRYYASEQLCPVSKKLRECPMLCVIHINDLIIFFFLSSNIHK